MLTEQHVVHVCLALAGDRRTCRYCVRDGPDYHCAKLSHLRRDIDEQIAVDAPALRADWPLGDNCPGYPLLRHVRHGFDA